MILYNRVFVGVNILVMWSSIFFIVLAKEYIEAIASVNKDVGELDAGHHRI